MGPQKGGRYLQVVVICSGLTISMDIKIDRNQEGVLKLKNNLVIKINRNDQNEFLSDAVFLVAL